jgi:hypothetical protein
MARFLSRGKSRPRLRQAPVLRCRRGQRLYAVTDLDLVVAMTCGNWAWPGEEQSRVTLTILVAVVLPLVT